MSMFDAIAIEAAQNCFNQTADAELALWSAENSLRERGKLLEDGEWWAGKTPDYKGPVVIIRIGEP